MNKLTYLKLNLQSNNIKDEVGIEIGKALSKLIKLVNLDLNLSFI